MLVREDELAAVVEGDVLEELVEGFVKLVDDAEVAVAV